MVPFFSTPNYISLVDFFVGYHSIFFFKKKTSFFPGEKKKQGSKQSKEDDLDEAVIFF
jgi:hypothetical protein